ncbi:hypothetical protein [Carnobacterium sp. TMP28]|uniref:hypothetical protein n=1 Tax=Carnobacterium sp. TMP28 TaxID=3397060 RepID=UPI0039E14908
MLLDKHGQENIELQRKKVKGLKEDSKQYAKYKKVFSENEILSTLDDFQNIKYNDEKEWEILKKKYREKL